jgi:hypothetical protein
VQDNPDGPAQARTAEALQLALTRGLTAACELIEAIRDPLAVAAAYNDFAQALYRRNMDVQGMIDAGHRGINFAIDHAARIESCDPKTAAKLKDAARKISYNIGANAWPGWGDDGFEISPEQRKAGLEAAMLSLRLVDDLNLGPRPTGKAYWLVGAHHIAARRPEAALAALDEAAIAFASAGDRPSELMARGYRALAGKLCTETRNAAQTELDDVLRCLEQDGSKAASFYRSQIEVADQILCAGLDSR